MLRLAIAGEPRFSIDERELGSGATGYTYDSLAALHRELPTTRLMMLIGADQYAKLETWYRWKELADVCCFAVFARPGSPALDNRARVAPMEPISVSASDIRTRISRCADVSAMLPAPVLAYIREHGLYR